MKKQELRKQVVRLCYDVRYMPDVDALRNTLNSLVDRFEVRIGGKPGAEDARDRFFAGLQRIIKSRKSGSRPLPPVQYHNTRFDRWVRKSALDLASKANVKSDEHRSWDRGDHLTVSSLDFVPPWESAAAPYHDMGGEGLALVTVTRTRVYAKSSRYAPSEVSTTFLVGRNECGTYFSHPVSPNCTTVEEAVQWIWNGKAYNIISRQGDIALISGNGGPKMPKYLPSGHKVAGGFVLHETHPALPMPYKPGERIIVGRRAAERASEATRD